MDKIINPSPCENCPNAKSKGGCHKPVNPAFSTTCKKWDEWFCESWQKVTSVLRGERGRR